MRFLLLLTLLGFCSAYSLPRAPANLPDSSLYQLDSPWKRDDGKTMKLAELSGQVRILTMFFSHCSNICPMIVGQLKTLEQNFPPAMRDRVSFVLVTLDAENDQDSALAQYRREMNLPADRWILLHGSQDDTRALANLLGVQYTPKKEDGQIQHTGLITILDREGRVREQTPGITDRTQFLKRLQAVVGP